MKPGDPETGNRMRMARVALRLSQEDVGERLDPKKSKQTVSAMETGDTKVSSQHLYQWAKICGTDVNTLVGW